MNKYIKKPIHEIDNDKLGRFERFNLIENPFPANPAVNKESLDKRINGDIYEIAIRKNEYESIKNNFLMTSQTDLNHLRLGYIIDSSYVGRGNGKTAFLINLLQHINNNYDLDISKNLNKCFAIYLSPEPGGRSKTFESFVDLIFHSIINSNIINESLISIYLEAIQTAYPKMDLTGLLSNEELLKKCLFDDQWYIENKIEPGNIYELIYSNKYLQKLPEDFPFFKHRGFLLSNMIAQKSFEDFYHSQLKRPDQKLKFIFTDLVYFFQSAGFNGAYVLVDDFERIPDFLSARQKRDFALELRSCLFDGIYLNPKIGFYNFLLVLHAGVPRLIEEAWAESGMDNRAPITPNTPSKHIIKFEKLSKEHVLLLLKKYLNEYRIKSSNSNDLSPFTEEAINILGELSEFNAAKVLKYAFELLEVAANSDKSVKIDKEFIEKNKINIIDTGSHSLSIEREKSINLTEKR